MQIFLFNIGLSEEGTEIKINDAVAANFPDIPTDFPINYQQVREYVKYASEARPDILASQMRQEGSFNSCERWL